LPEGLARRGADVVVVPLYDTVAEHLNEAQLAAVERADFITFTSSSTVKFFMQALGERGLPNGARVVSIGPITSDTARELGLEVHAEAAKHDIDGLVETLLAEAAAS
jgi:uroporphyrinogen-III synthase